MFELVFVLCAVLDFWFEKYEPAIFMMLFAIYCSLQKKKKAE